ncbi:helix-turn-helix domain-containing protein [Chryseobacterium sp. MA9]|uniref:helix-turn-helix domain-containing protein n=1 Tax=Chryseobacterium sp. MA9 TaxID=2966625 RepID=UPI002103D6C2|nr:helix-turn-helix domain-containing protein [Chryseobacterium sp. MA9]UTX48911.1 helix-turn-helix domain-containing protein [Chryseobacterium sp. MA9]
MGKLKPDYKRIYTDLINTKYPDKLRLCRSLLHKDKLTILDMFKLNHIIWEGEDQNMWQFSQKHKSYNKETVMEILDYQVKNKLNNTELASHFKLSRNTLARWKKLFVLHENSSY